MGTLSKTRSRRWKDYPYIETFAFLSCTLKYLRREKTKINVCYAGTRTLPLWEISLGSKPDQFLEFYPSIPRSTQPNIFIWLAELMPRSKELESSLFKQCIAIWEITCAEKEVVFPVRGYISFFHSIQNRKLSPNGQMRLHLKEISQTTESYFLHPLFESAS